MLPKFNIHWPGRNTGQVMSARTAAEAVLTWNVTKAF
jgi:hypothetical protein